MTSLKIRLDRNPTLDEVEQEFTNARRFSVGVYLFLLLGAMLFGLTYGAICSFKLILALNAGGELDGIKAEFIDYTMWPTGKMIVALLIALIGFLLVWLKKKQQFYYGLAESAFALANCFLVVENFAGTAIKHEQSFVIFIVSVMTTVYLTVRGLSNLFDGLGSNSLLRGLFTKEQLYKVLDKLDIYELPNEKEATMYEEVAKRLR